jgi:hypothetical protein
MPDLDDFRARLRIELHDEDSNNYRWTDATLNRHLVRASNQISLVRPREQKTTLQTSAGSRELSLSSLTDLVRIEAVEWPVDQWPRRYVAFSVWGTTLEMLTDETPAGTEDAAVYWGSLHTLTTSASTLPTHLEDILVLGGAAYAALEWASFATNRANVAGAQAVEDYQAWGEQKLRQFGEELQKLASRVKTSRLFQPAATGPNQSAVQWQP